MLLARTLCLPGLVIAAPVAGLCHRPPLTRHLAGYLVAMVRPNGTNQLTGQQLMSEPPDPPPPQPQFPYPAPVNPPTTRTNRFVVPAWLGLGFGIAGVVGIPVIILNNATALLAVVGVVCAIIGLCGSRKLIAGIGLALCLGGIIGTVAIQAQWTDTINAGTVSDASTTPATPDDTPAPNDATTNTAKPPPTWGQRYTWDDGLAVELGVPVGCQPGEYAQPPSIQRAVKVPMTIINGTNRQINSVMFYEEVQFNGQSAETIYDSGESCGSSFDSGTILPGKNFSTSISIAVGPQPGELQIALGLLGGDKAVFVGPA